MTPQIAKRLDALEHRVRPSRIGVIFITAIRPGNLEAITDTATCKDRTWTRAEGESKESFRARITESLPDDNKTVHMVILKPKET